MGELEEACPTEDAIMALLEYLVSPMLPSAKSINHTPSLPQQQSVAKQVSNSSSSSLFSPFLFTRTITQTLGVPFYVFYFYMSLFINIYTSFWEFNKEM